VVAADFATDSATVGTGLRVEQEKLNQQKSLFMRRAETLVESSKVRGTGRQSLEGGHKESEGGEERAEITSQCNYKKKTSLGDRQDRREKSTRTGNVHPVVVVYFLLQ
jgi:hypothetical protein